MPGPVLVDWDTESNRQLVLPLIRVRIDHARAGSDCLSSAPAPPGIFISLSRFPHVCEMGTIIEPASVGIAKINSRDNSYETLAQSLVCMSSNRYQCYYFLTLSFRLTLFS